MKIGDKATLARAFSEDNVRSYQALGGAAAPAGVVPEPMIAALFSYLLGVRLPGPGANYLKQSLTFHGAAKVGEEIAASVEITRMRPDKCLIDLETICLNSEGKRICSGRALILASDVSGAFGEA